jgi:quercetin dioxygenase-like cupin family protein
MGYHVVRAGDHVWEERTGLPGHEDQPLRHASDLTEQAELKESRARLWRLPAGTRGRRHADKVQEEIFVVVSGTLTMHLGDPPETVELPAQSVVAVEPGTALQMQNASDGEVVVFAYGAPPLQEGADFFEDA